MIIDEDFDVIETPRGWEMVEGGARTADEWEMVDGEDA
jgi:hypothetical protein